MPPTNGADEPQGPCSAFWDICCTERVLSPILVLSLHLTIVIVVVVHREPLLEVHGAWEALEWLLVFACLTCYISTNRMDPGWLPEVKQPVGQPLWQTILCCCCCCCCCRRRAASVDAAASSATVVGKELEDAAEMQSAGEENVPLQEAVDAGGVQKRRGGNDDAGGEGPVPLQCGHELRWCNRCHVYQPLRTKHCRDCGRCVRTHDHHCPWVGTCVGENNRVPFMWFLIFQCLELAAFFGEGVRGISIINPSVVLLVCLLVIAMFFLMVFCLLLFHGFLALSGLTTWEHSSRNRISYMKGVPLDRVSPWTRSILFNVKSYCFGPRWCPAPLRRMASLRYDEAGGVIWELVEGYRPCCLLRHCADSC